FHRKCFRCHTCNRPLDQGTGFHQHEKSGILLCDRDHAARTRPPCASCSAPISGKPVKALGAYWHEAHFLCAHCRQPLLKGYVEHRGRAYCPEDFSAMFLPRCKGCRKPVEKEALVALDAKWHVKCFGCQVCHRPFPNKSFYVLEGRPYCKYHYHQENNSLCGMCEEPIEGPCAQVIEGRYHPRCFFCNTCREPLTDVYYNFQGKFYCERDVQTVQARGSKKAERRKTFFNNL
ncbi:MAG: LIM domain-containing protein, partial [Piptocephalis tieghemiana]